MVDNDTNDTLAVATNVGDVTNAIENMENDGIFIGKDYNWGHRIHKVSKSFIPL